MLNQVQAPETPGHGGPVSYGLRRRLVFGRIEGGGKRDNNPFVGFKGGSGGTPPPTAGVVGNSGGGDGWIGYIKGK